MTDTTRRRYGAYGLWGLHTLMLGLFLLLEATGFRIFVGSSVFYLVWIAVWLMHGLTLVLEAARRRELLVDDATMVTARYWRRLGLAGHSALYIAFGPVALAWWVMTRMPGPQQPGEGQGFWIYPLWLMVLLAHGAIVMTQEAHRAGRQGEKRKRSVQVKPNRRRLYRLAQNDEWVEAHGAETDAALDEHHFPTHH